MNSAPRTSAPGKIKAASPVLPARLACAISPDERRLFMAEADLLGVSIYWFEQGERQLSIEQWHELNPQILLTGWSTVPPPREWLDSPQCALRYVCHLTGSIRQLLPREFIERGGLVSNWGDIPSFSVAEHGLLLALAALRNIGSWLPGSPHPRDTIERVERLQTRSLAGLTVGIHGFGRVARSLVTLLRPFGVQIHAYSQGVPGSVYSAAGVVGCNSLEELFSQSEVLFECEALTPATQGSVSASVLARLPAGAVFVNVGRGGLVNEAALLREATSGRLRVALDVVSTESFAPEGPFNMVAGAVLSPHIAGPTFDQYQRCGEYARRNIARFLSGQTPEALITAEDYDRAT
jgi:phosphoglycerate dehydrogenase-like enzyme